jgi:hypothetical protein
MRTASWLRFTLLWSKRHAVTPRTADTHCPTDIQTSPYAADTQSLLVLRTLTALQTFKPNLTLQTRSHSSYCGHSLPYRIQTPPSDMQPLIVPRTLHTSHYILKAVPSHAMEALGGEEIQLLLINELGTRWGEWSASRSGRALSPGKEAVWIQRLEEKCFCLCRGSNIDRPVVHSVVRQYTDWATPAPWHYIQTR